MSGAPDVAERALMQDLLEAGLQLADEDVWLLQLPDDATRRRAYPILVDHLERGRLPASAMAAVATHLSRATARPYWSRLAAVFAARDPDWARETLAGALAASAGRKELPRLEELFLQHQNDVVSVIFVRALLRLDRTRWGTYFQERNAGAVWGVEARAALAGRALND